MKNQTTPKPATPELDPHSLDYALDILDLFFTHCTAINKEIKRIEALKEPGYEIATKAATKVNDAFVLLTDTCLQELDSIKKMYVSVINTNNTNTKQ